ncbi:acyltransferase [Limnohabitans sp. Rim47]|uniref:acyltransferase family protein n=1 Tax=Limnohabitans sp. Rim47 TaxID=1100721 RepID=UPI0003642A49|nr:acyltransferase [Limnohabitans sp. Rim47]
MTDRISAVGLDAPKAASTKTKEHTTTAIGGSLRSLESLRILAALLVVCAHLSPYKIPVLGQFFGANRFLGSIGVDLFFVISGVVIGLSTVRAVTGTMDSPLRNFLVARIFRIFPLYWVVTAISIALLWQRGRPLPAWDELLHSLTLIPRLDNGQYVDPIVAIGWTLQFEIFFYSLCALGILARSKYLPIIAAIALSAASFAFDGYYLNPILLEFAGGYAFALYLANQKQPIGQIGFPLATVLVVASTALFLFAATGRDAGYPPAFDLMQAPRMMIAFGDAYIPRWLAWGLPAFIIVVVALRLENSLSWRLASLGKYTYSVYLCHTFAISAALILARRFGQEEIMVAVLPICLFLIAGFTCWTIEQPMIKAGKHLTKRLRAATPSP